MKNLKLTLATALSVMALTLTGTAFADGDRGHSNFKRSVDKSSAKILGKNIKRNHYASNKKVTKRIVVKNTPAKKVFVTKTVIHKPAKRSYSKTKRFAYVKRFNRQYKRYQKQMRYGNSYKRNKGFKQKRVKKQRVYSVRPGDTLIQISYKTGVSIQKLARLNRIKHRNLNYLQVGQLLRLG